MIFERGWFIRKMNKYAPRGYTFVILDDEGRIAMHATDITGDQEPRGPFVSNISFDMLDSLYGGLMTRRNRKIHQACTVADYMFAYDIARPQMFAPDAKTATEQESKYEIYRSIARDHAHRSGKPLGLFMRKNALLIQGLQDSNVPLPAMLATRLNQYVNKCTWYAIEKVMSSMPICDMKYYQDLYRQKMSFLGIEYGQTFGKKFGLIDVDKIAFEKRHKDLTVEIERLMYDVLPRQEKALSTKKNKRPDDTSAHEKLQTQLENTNNRIAELSQERDSVAPREPRRPARYALSNVFYKSGNATRPEFSKNSIVQFMQMAFLQETKQRKK